MSIFSRNVTMATFEDSDNHPQLSPHRYLSHPPPKPDFPVSKTGQTDCKSQTLLKQ